MDPLLFTAEEGVVSSSEHFVWAADGKPVSVHVAAGVIRQLEARLSAKSAGREPEIGGLLLGRARQVNDSWIVAVEAIEFAACEHARGPSWTLSKADRAAFARQMRRLSKHGVVGWFRTHTRPGLYLDEHDFQLFRDFFPHPAAVTLAVRDDAEAGFFFWENGEVVRNRPYVTFTCRAGALNLTPEPVKDIVLPLPAAASSLRMRKELLWAPLAAAVALGVLWTPRLPFDEPPQERTRVAERPVFAPPPLPEPEPEPEIRPAAVVVRKPTAMPAPAVLETPKPPRTPRRVEPEVVAKAEVPKPNAIKRAVGSIPGLGFLKKPKKAQLDVPAVATRQVAPSRFRESYPVRVKVKIGTDGFVKSAHLLTSSASADTVQAVMRAARSWRFAPARHENRPVESELVLTFEPHPNGTD